MYGIIFRFNTNLRMLIEFEISYYKSSKLWHTCKRHSWLQDFTHNYKLHVPNLIDSNFTSMIFYYLDTSVGMVYSSEYDFKSNQHREENDNKGIANECSSFTTALISVAVLSLMSLLITLYTYLKQQRVKQVMESSCPCRPKCHIWETQDDPYLVF